MVEQNTPLNILTLGNFPTIHDLPVSPAFGVFTGHVQDTSTIESKTAAFRLRRDAYDGVTSLKVTMSILCKYEPAGRHQNVSDATQRQPIFSVAGELVMLKKSVCILCDVIKWSNPNQNTGNPKTSDNKQILKDKKRRNEDLEKLAKKFDKSPSNNSTQQESNETNGETQQESNKANEETQQELTNLNPVNKNAEAQNNSVKHNQTNNLHTRVEDYTEDQFSEENESVQQDAEIYESSSSP
ncbi:22519_t:CDS:2 [Gigaspora rosea]|nr:22519_t:CDS:2 [Gigaspora rosea]